MLYLIESQTNLRAHNGVAYIYDPVGAWLPYSGLVSAFLPAPGEDLPAATGGVFRAPPPTTARAETAILVVSTTTSCRPLALLKTSCCTCSEQLRATSAGVAVVRTLEVKAARTTMHLPI